MEGQVSLIGPKKPKHFKCVMVAHYGSLFLGLEMPPRSQVAH